MNYRFYVTSIRSWHSANLIIAAVAIIANHDNIRFIFINSKEFLVISTYKFFRIIDWIFPIVCQNVITFEICQGNLFIPLLSIMKSRCINNIRKFFIFFRFTKTFYFSSLSNSSSKSSSSSSGCSRSAICLSKFSSLTAWLTALSSSRRLQCSSS